mgnify:FL=1
MRRLYQLIYVPGTPAYRFKGTEEQLQIHLQKKNAVVISGKNGTWKVAVPAYHRIREIVGDQVTREICPDKFLHAYGLKRISKRACIELISRLNTGEITFNELLEVW